MQERAVLAGWETRLYIFEVEFQVKENKGWAVQFPWGGVDMSLFPFFQEPATDGGVSLELLSSHSADKRYGEKITANI